MKEFEVNGKTYKLPVEWTEVTLRNYLDLVKLSNNRVDVEVPELYLIKVIEKLAGCGDGELDDLTITEFNNLTESINFIYSTPEFTDVKAITIGDIDYCFIDDFSKITMGEMISLKMVIKDNSNFDSIPDILSIILRPGKKEVDSETGNEKWIIEKFDTTNLEYRKNLFMDQPVINLMGPVNFFLTLIVSSTKNMKDYTSEELEVKGQEVIQ